MTAMLLILLTATPNEAAKLFDEGRTSMKAGDIAKACDAFARSHQLEPALGTLLNLATCLEKQGKVAAAWLRFNDAVGWAQRTHEAEREALARGRAKELRPRVSWLSLSSVDDVTVLVDGEPVHVSSVPVAVPVEAGMHAVSVELPGFQPWRATLTIPTEGATVTQEVPRLSPDRAELPPPPLPPLTVATPAPVVVTNSKGTAGIGLIAGGGAVAVLAAVGLAWSLGTYGTLQGQRIPNGTAQVTVSNADFQRLKWIYPLSWTGLAVGVVAAVAGVFFVIRGNGVAVGGSF